MPLAETPNYRTETEREFLAFLIFIHILKSSLAIVERFMHGDRVIVIDISQIQFFEKGIQALFIRLIFFNHNSPARDGYNELK